MPPSSSQDFQPYFVPGYGISRHIIVSHIQYFLGPYATVRPYQYRGREGFLVNAPGQLTKSQIEDLQSLSRQYEYQAAERMVSPQQQGQSAEQLYINQPVQVPERHRRRF
ncbi:MAG: hypothetical protein LQ340_002489 [Diploschistes diacapsis]|nr:MAG: hypothetical protein LQ340_002489 [Diploschistes diacapsis]